MDATVFLNLDTEALTLRTRHPGQTDTVQRLPLGTDDPSLLGATLLVLRECMHHWRCQALVLQSPSAN